jgi:hypothetical protein
MKYFSPLVILLLMFLFSCVTAYAPYESRYIPADFPGIVHAGNTKTQEEFDFLNRIGAKWALQTFYWSSIEPSKGNWDFIGYDEMVDKTNSAGIKMLGILAYDNKWIHDDNKSKRYIPPEKIPDFLEYVRRTVEHFRGRVGAWCIWNEPNFHFWKGSDAEFIELSRLAADVIKETDSEVILLAGAFNRNFTGLPEKFIRSLFESGAMEKADAIAFHPYELNPSRALSLYKKFKNITADYGFENKIWITEVGYPTGGLYPTKVKESRFPEYLVKTWALLASAGANRLIWYQLFDPHTRKSVNSEDYFGLARSSRDYTSKAAEAFRLCSVYLSDSILIAQTPGHDLPKTVHSFRFEKETGGALILWNEGAGTKQVSLQLPGINHTRHDIVTGSEISISPQLDIRVGKTPEFITWENTADNPVE